LREEIKRYETSQCGRQSSNTEVPYASQTLLPA
jgi:hypothetical protein